MNKKDVIPNVPAVDLLTLMTGDDVSRMIFSEGQRTERISAQETPAMPPPTTTNVASSSTLLSISCERIKEIFVMRRKLLTLLLQIASILENVYFA